MPKIDWSVVGDGVVLSSYQKIIDKRKEEQRVERESIEEKKRLDKIAREINRREQKALETSEQKIKDVIEVLKSKRKVSAEAANAYIRDLQSESKEVKNLQAIIQRARETAKRHAAERAAEDEKELQRLIAKNQARKREVEAAFARGDAIEQRNQTPQERLAQKQTELNQLLLQGAISAEAAAREHARLTEQYREETGAAQQARDATARLEREQRDNERAAEEVRRGMQRSEGTTRRYSRRLEELRRLHRVGALTASELAQAEAHLRREITDVADASERAAKADRERRAQQIRERNDPNERYRRGLAEAYRLQKAGALSSREYRMEVARLKRELNAAGQAGRQAFSPNIAGNLQSFVMTTFGAGSAVAAFREEMMALKQFAESRAQTQMDAATARRNLKFNLLGATPQQRAFVLGRANELPAQTGVGQQRVDQVMQNTISAAPTISRGVAFAEFGLRGLKDMPGSDEIVGGMLDIANALNTDNPELAAGFGQVGILRSRATDPRKYFTNAPRVLGAAALEGMSAARAGAVFNALAVGGADKDLEVSRTAAINLFSRLGKYFTEEKAEELGIPFSSVDTLDEQLDYVMANRDEAINFLGAFDFRAAGRTGVADFLTGRTQAGRDAYNLTLRDLSDRQGLIQKGRGLADFLNTGRFEGTAELNRNVGTLNEQAAFLQAPALNTEQTDNLVRTLVGGRQLYGLDTDFVGRTSLGVRGQLFAQYGTSIDATEAQQAVQGELDFIAGRRATLGGYGSQEPQVQQIETLLRQSLEYFRRTAEASERAAENNPPQQE